MRHYQGCPKRLFFGALLYAAWALLAAESFLAAFSNGSRIQKVLRILLAAAAIGLASVSFIIFNNMY